MDDFVCKLYSIFIYRVSLLGTWIDLFEQHTWRGDTWAFLKIHSCLWNLTCCTRSQSESTRKYRKCWKKFQTRKTQWNWKFKKHRRFKALMTATQKLQELGQGMPPPIWKFLAPLNRKSMSQSGSLNEFLYPDYEVNEDENREGSKLHKFCYCWIFSE